MNSDSKLVLELQNRLHDLESRWAFQEDTITQLNCEIIEQHKMIDNLNLQVEALRNAVQAVSPGNNVANNVVDEKPPHY